MMHDGANQPPEERGMSQDTRHPVTRRGTAVSRRAVLTAAAAAGGSLALPALRPRPARAQSDRHGGLLRVSVTFGLATINPIMHISGAEWIGTKWMYNNLTRLTAKREVVPDLAESWTAGDNARVWTFKLRPGVKFHSGRELQADDVVATFTTLIDPKTASPYRGEVGPIDRVEAVDRQAVRFTLRAPFAVFPATMSLPNARIVAREGLGDLKALASREFGTGPFKLKEFVPGDRLVVERHADYFRKGQPYLDGAVLRVFPEPSTELTAFRSKEVDLISGLTPDLYSQVATLTGAEAMAVAGGTFAAVILPADKPPFNDNRVREALKFCVDRGPMLTAIHSGQGELGNDHPISTAYPEHAALPPRMADVSRARALLRDAGHGGGVSVKLFAANSPPIREKIAVVLKEMARPAGFNIDVEVVAYDRYLAQVWNKGVPYVCYYGTRPTADAILTKLYHPKEGLDEGRWAATNPGPIRLLDQARETLDAGRRRQIYGEFQKVSRDEGPFMLPFFANELNGRWGFVRDYQLNPAGFDMVLDEVWLAPDAPRKKA
jgi:peptide/nickel transport system substrate-binding protein